MVFFLADQVKTWVLQVYVPTTYTSPADQINLGTMWLGYIPSNLVDTLAALIKAKQSKFYTGVPIPAAQDLAERVNAAFSLRSVANPNTDSGGSGSGNGGTTSGGGSKGNGASAARQDAIIGVVSAFGAIALLVLVFLVYHSIKRKKELAHRRLSDRASGADVQVGGGGRVVGVRPEGREFDEDSVGGARRRSFYYAEDSLRGYQAEGREEQMVQVQQEGVATRIRTSSPQSAVTISQRKAIVPAAISAPILRESSMNW